MAFWGLKSVTLLTFPSSAVSGVFIGTISSIGLPAGALILGENLTDMAGAPGAGGDSLSCSDRKALKAWNSPPPCVPSEASGWCSDWSCGFRVYWFSNEIESLLFWARDLPRFLLLSWSLWAAIMGLEFLASPSLVVLTCCEPDMILGGGLSFWCGAEAASRWF